MSNTTRTRWAGTNSSAYVVDRSYHAASDYECFEVVEQASGRVITVFENPDNACQAADELAQGEATEAEVAHTLYDGASAQESTPAAIETTPAPEPAAIQVVLTRTQVDVYLTDREHHQNGDEDQKALWSLLSKASGRRNVRLTLNTGQATDVRAEFEFIAQCSADNAGWDPSSRGWMRAARNAVKRLTAAGALSVEEFNAQVATEHPA
ncbi:hypothetical protein ACFC26_21705 [Kitasatospora purpeofusca]|uniref:hypothetical protein n=1 Tax=Kitasatospora purpeofusca TaxID=67352 RepID=UPI0035D6F082